MNPPCARCKKTVYPTEKLNCLDKTWHKMCFTCETCNMKLTMKTYKGYNKLPYCNTHYPTTKFTAVADTPENKRLAKNTQQQSNLVYHSEFEKAKGHYTAVEDDPETVRAKKSSKQISDIKYKGGIGHPNQPADPYGYPDEPAPVSHQPPPAVPTYQPPPAAVQPPPPAAPAPAPPTSASPRYRSLYDYAAADEDEVSFIEGDVFSEVVVVDSGWMEGRVVRTGEYGMFPSNYVETF